MSRSRSDGDTWVDALGGFRADYSITPRVYLAGWGLVGGGAADIDWDIAATIGYKFNDRISSVLGYRALGILRGNECEVRTVARSASHSFVPRLDESYRICAKRHGARSKPGDPGA
jgi:hypothetical protein